MMTSQTAKVPNLGDLGIILATFASRNAGLFLKVAGVCVLISDLIRVFLN